MEKEDLKKLEDRIEKFVDRNLAPALEQKCSAQVMFYGINEQLQAKMGLKTSCGNCPRAKATILQSTAVAVMTFAPEITGVEPFYK